MEIKRISENQIRCALTEAEIREMGFEIDDILGDSEMTRRFMRVVLDTIEEQENINMDQISSMVRAELLQDHSMAITFGGDNEISFKDLLETVNQLVSQLNPERVEEFRKASKEQKRQVIEALLDDCRKRMSKDEEAREEEPEENFAKGTMTCALVFLSMDDMVDLCRKCNYGKFPHSSLYKLDGFYYIILDFEGFTKKEMRPFAVTFMEYDEGHISDDSQLANIMEQGDCLIKKEALQIMGQL